MAVETPQERGKRMLRESGYSQINDAKVAKAEGVFKRGGAVQHRAKGGGVKGKGPTTVNIVIGKDQPPAPRPVPVPMPPRPMAPPMPPPGAGAPPGAGMPPPGAGAAPPGAMPPRPMPPPGAVPPPGMMPPHADGGRVKVKSHWRRRGGSV